MSAASAADVTIASTAVYTCVDCFNGLVSCSRYWEMTSSIVVALIRKKSTWGYIGFVNSTRISMEAIY